MKKLIEMLFPPKLGFVRQYEFSGSKYVEEGACGKAQERMYRDALDRITKERRERKGRNER